MNMHKNKWSKNEKGRGIKTVQERMKHKKEENNNYITTLYLNYAVLFICNKCI
jgi:hypothetical protein